MAKVLPAAEVGHYLLGLAVTAPVVLFSMCQLRAVYVTDVQNKHGFEDVLGARLVSNFVAVLIVSIILLILAGKYSFDVYIVILIIALNKVVEATSDIAYGVMQKHDRLDKVAQSMILRNLGGCMFLAVVIKVSGSLLLGVASIGIWWLGILLFFDRRIVFGFTNFTARFCSKAILPIFSLGLPLGIVMGILSINSNVTRYFVQGYLGSENLAYFGAMAYVVVGASRAAMSLGQSASAPLSRYYHENRHAYVRLLQKILMITLVLGICIVLFGVCFGKKFLSLVYTPEYAERQDVFVWLLLAAGATMIASMLGYGMTAARRFKSQIPVFILSCGVSILASWLLIPRYEMKGAAWAMLAGTLVQFMGSLVVIAIALRAPVAQTDSEIITAYT